MPTPDTTAALLKWADGQQRDTLLRARTYVREGRVRAVVPSGQGDGVSARVIGQSPYDVEIHLDRTRQVHAFCTCPAWGQFGGCKHAVAVALSLGPDPEDDVPRPFSPRAGGASTMSRVALYAERPVPIPDVEWHSLEVIVRRAPEVSAALRAAGPKVSEVMEALRTWEPPPLAYDDTAYGSLYAALAKDYLERRDRITLTDALPGPLDARHAGFDLRLDTLRDTLVLRERTMPRVTPLSIAVGRLTIGVPKVSRQPWGMADCAWTAFALRALLITLHERRDPATQQLAAQLGEPEWARVLKSLSRGKDAEVVTADDAAPVFAFSLDTWSKTKVSLGVSAIEQKKKGERARRATFAEVLDAPMATELERQIARTALSEVEEKEVEVDPATVHGHELLRLLEGHARVTRRVAKKDPEAPAAAVKILIGEVTLRFVTVGDGGVQAELCAGGEALGREELELCVDKREGFVASIDEREDENDTLVVRSYAIPRPLRPWVRAFLADRPLIFPKEAVTEVLAQTGALMNAGLAQFPRAALGSELHPDPAIGLRVEWRPDGSALVRAMYSAHPFAPLLTPGRGPELFSFMVDTGERAFVERDLSKETAVVDAARAALPLSLEWHDNVAGTQSVEEALALAELITKNQRAAEDAGDLVRSDDAGLRDHQAAPRLRIEVRAGRAPNAIPFDSAKSTFSVRRAGAYLFVSGEIELGDAKVSLGEVLEALRKAKRYVRAGEAGFLELTEEVRRKLLPLASVAVPSGEEEASARVHQALAVVVAAAGQTFADRKGVDVAEIVTRHKENATKIKEAPALEQGTLRRYQEEGVEFLLRLASWASGGILADDMGLGKTVQTASVLQARRSLGPALVVAPASVVSNWERELARFSPSLRVRSMYEDTGAEPSPKDPPADVWVTSYGLLARRRKELEKTHFATVVLDEAHYVKNVSAARTAAVRALTRDFTIALTGTPLENHLGELYSLVDVTLPGVFGSEQMFRERFRRPIEVEGDKERLLALGRLLSPFLLRRTRASVLAELPPREEIVETLSFSEEEGKRYRALREAALLSFGKKHKERGQPKDAELRIALFAALTRLRQLACDPRLVDGSYDGATTKVTRVVELVSQIKDEGAHVLVYSQFAELVKLIARALREAGIEPLVLTGETRQDARQDIVDRFQSGSHAALCASLMAGGVGLNLTRASHVIHVDPWWNPAAEEQATSRAHRMGQTEPVTVVRLITKGTIEEAVLKMHAEKRSLADAILSGKSAPKELSSDELLRLLSFGG